MTTSLAEARLEAGFAHEYPFASHDLLIDGVRLHYVDEGTGEPVLFVHGNPTWSFAWRNFIKALAPSHRAIAIDHVGCGFSDKPQVYDYSLARHIHNLCEVVTRLDLRQVTLVAHDWGGAIGLGAVEQLKDRFSRLVLMNTAAFRSQRIPWRIAVCRVPVFGPLAVRGLNGFARAALWMATEYPRRLSPAVRSGYLAPYGTWHDRVAILRFVQDIPLSPAHPSHATLKGIEDRLSTLTDLPLLLMWGERDWCFTTAFLDEFRRRFPAAEVTRFPQAGHYVFEDACPDAIARLQTFLTEHPVTKCALSS